MKNPPSFQFYPQDFISDFNVISMSMEERGIYISLLCVCWIEDGIPIPNGDPIATLFKSEKVARCFYKKNGRFRNHRLDRERQKQLSFHKSQKEAGIRGAEARWGRHSKPIATPMAKHSSSSSSSTSVLNPPLPPAKEKPETSNCPVSEVVSYLNEKTGARFSAKSSDTIKHVAARIKEGRTIDDFKRVIDSKCAKWKGQTWTDSRPGREGQIVRGDDFLCPSTLFCSKNFEKYLNESGASKPLSPEEWKARQAEELRRQREKDNASNM